MSPLAGRGCWTLVVAAVVAALAGWPAVASGAVDIKAATIDGTVNDSSSPPGGVLLAKATAGVTSGSTWRATEVRWRGAVNYVDCIDHRDQDVGPGNQERIFYVTAPGKPGTYDVGFYPSEQNNCSTTGTGVTNSRGLRVTAPATNPALPQRCDINVMLVLDESGSIASSGATEKVRQATRGFLNLLSGTGCKVSIVDFSTTASWPVGYHVVTGEVDSDGGNASGTIGDYFEPYLRNGYEPGGWTNWEDAFKQVKLANAKGPGNPVADLVLFMTDGDPTARNTNSGGTVTNLVEGEAEALRRAAVEADVVKSQGARVFALGVGAAVTKPTSARRLTAVSGSKQYPSTPFRTADYTLVQDFDDLRPALREIVVGFCGEPEPGTPPPAPLTPLEPAPPPTPPPSTRLRVVKTMPSVARVGQRVGFRLTVTNVGSVAARRVRMIDLPPGAVALAALRSSTRARVVNGGAVWNLGRLAPGAKRTIRGSVLITAGTPGLKRNLVAATAVNAKLVGDRADTRLRAPRQVPPVTG